MIKKVETYKKITNHFTTALMGLACVFTLITLAYQQYSLSNTKFYVERTRRDITKEIDYENVTSSVVYYFLYRNQTPDAADELSSNNRLMIVEDPFKLCPLGFQLNTDLNRVIAIRDNIFSPYMIVSDIYIFILMLATAVLLCIWIPFFMKEHHLPIFLRNSNSNHFYDALLVRIYSFLFFITLSGSLP